MSYPPRDEEQVELEEILVSEYVLTHKEKKIEVKVTQHSLMKFWEYLPLDAKWMEEVT